ncbi:MAG TPA: membrane protein insertase YidC [Candidatus Binatia bacterium]|nr:membrane protein insertase YidC [Candidatus Binatia bacterium]
MEQSRLLIAFLISLVIVIAYQKFVLSKYEPPRPAATQQPVSVPAEPAAPVATEQRPPATGVLGAPVGDEGLIHIETDVFRIAITPIGARLADIELKAFRRTVDRDSAPLDLVQAEGTPPVLPGTLALGANAADAGLHYRTDRVELVLHGSDSGEITLAAETPTGLQVQKRYRFTGDQYVFTMTASASGNGAPASVGLVLTPIPVDSTRTRETAVAVLSGPELLFKRACFEKAIADLKGQTSVESSTWAGFAAQYFLTAAVPSAGSTPATFTVPDKTAPDGTPTSVQVEAGLADGQAVFDIYAGPKERDGLTRAGRDLERTLYFGWFWFIAIPLLRALRLLHAAFGNYGVSIIVLTALVKLATAPLTRTTFRNMREMQKIQPQMAKLRERFKDDQMALQKEMMELYRRHRVNPFSGCLPMLLQLPIFVGLYNALLHAIELRHAPFALWINDLSAPDRLRMAWIPAGTPFIGDGVPVLTLVMGASMLVQQSLTPQQGDPTQQRMMMFMPLVMTFMFINFPAGLVLYWLVNNLLTIGQQYLMMRTMK